MNSANSLLPGAALRALLACSLLLATGSCDRNPTGTPSDPARIGPEGGTLRSADGAVTLEIPPGALAQPATFSVQATTAHPAGAVGTVYRIEPSGTRFDPPATLRIRPPATLPDGLSPADLRIATVENGGWTAVPTTLDAADGALRAAIPHLSTWALVPVRRSEPVTCPDLRLSADRARPFDRIVITGIPAEFGELLAGEVVTGADDRSLPGYIERAESGAILLTPLHPSGSAAGGQARLRVRDENGLQCQSVPFTIEPLSSAPGAFAQFVDAFEELLALQAEAAGTSLQQLRNTDPATAPFHLLPLVLSHQLLEHSDNPNSLRAIANGTAPLLEGATPDEAALLEALTARSGLTTQVQALSREMRASAVGTATRRGAALSASPVALAAAAPAAQCTGDFYRPDAADLAYRMKMSSRAGVAVDEGAYLDLSSFLFSVGGVLGTVEPTGAGKRLAAWYGSMGLGIFAFQKSVEFMDGVYPSRFVTLDFEHAPAEFLEDDDPDGAWDEALVVAESKGWSATKFVLESLLQASGTKAAGGLRKWFEKYTPGETATELAAGFQKVMAENLVGRVIGRSTDGSEALQVGPCRFGPTDISDEEWSEADILDPTNAPVVTTAHGFYRARDTGEALLRVRTRERVFGHTGMAREKPIRILPIEITITPASARVEPGAAVDFTATVNNANDPGLEWTITPRGGHRILQVGDLTNFASVLTSADARDFPAVLRARSTSTGGVRGNPNSPERFAEVRIVSDRAGISVSPEGACIEPGGTLQLAAEVFGLEDPRVSWSATEGTVSPEGVFTAPSGFEGTAVVQATSMADPSISGTAQVVIGRCSCQWTGELSGASSYRGDVTFIERAANGALELVWLQRTVGDLSDIVSLSFDRADLPMPGSTGTYRVASAQGMMVASGDAFIDGTSMGLPGLQFTVEHFEDVDDGGEQSALLRGTVEGQVLVYQLGGRFLEEHLVMPFRARVEGYYDWSAFGRVHCTGMSADR